MKKVLLLLMVIFSIAMHGNGQQYTATTQDYFTTVTFPAGYAIGDYIEFVKVMPISAWASGNYNISITYTRGNMAAAATYKASISHYNPALWREAGKVNSNKYGGNSANFTVDCNTEYGNCRFRIRAIGTGGTLTEAMVVNIRVTSVNHNYSWTALNVTGNDLTVNKFLPMTDEWNLYMGTPYSAVGANLAIHATAHGNVGIGGIPNAAYKLDVNGIVHAVNSFQADDGVFLNKDGSNAVLNGIRLNNAAKNRGFNLQLSADANPSLSFWALDPLAGWARRMDINANGNVLIGKTTQTNTGYKLDVNGTVRANKLVINTTGADFVFEKGYRLPSLDSVEQYVKANQHLPGIAPAAEMQKEGVEVGEQQTKLLQKIEELTLYIIEQNKKIEKQGAQLQQQGEEIRQLKAKLK